MSSISAERTGGFLETRKELAKKLASWTPKRDFRSTLVLAADWMRVSPKLTGKQARQLAEQVKVVAKVLHDSHSLNEGQSDHGKS